MSDPGSAPKRTLWTKYVERATAPNPYPIIETGIPMRDGLQLAASICLPHRSERPAPAIVCITPYDKANLLGAGTEAEFYQRHGYAFVVVDCRGRGKSDGTWHAFVNDADDGYDAVEWVAAQPWCTSKVGATGLSYASWAGWATASRRPPHLACLISSAAPAPWTHGRSPVHGCTPFAADWRVRGVRGRRWDHGDTPGFDTIDGEPGEESFDSVQRDGFYEQIDVPCLHVNGWYDRECLLSGFQHYEQLKAKSPAASRQRLIVGPWSHEQTRRPHHTHGGVHFGEAAATDLNHVHRRWFEFWLNGVENGALDEAPVQLFETGSNRWIEAERWPLPSSTMVLALHFDGETGSLSPELNEVTLPRTYRDDPFDPAPAQFDLARYPFEDPPLDQRAVEAREDVLVWTSDPVSQELAISGRGALALLVSSDGDDTEFHIKLTDVGPDGASNLVAHGCLRASCRDSRDGTGRLVPGEPALLAIELGPAQHCFLPGHRMRISVTGSDAPWFRPRTSPAGARVAINTIHGGHLSLPVSRGGM
jgi:predicted acyl esterase